MGRRKKERIAMLLADKCFERYAPKCGNCEFVWYEKGDMYGFPGGFYCKLCGRRQAAHH